MNISYRIMGVPKRMENIRLLQQQLGIDGNHVFLDTEYRKNPMWTWKKTALLDVDKEATHVCIIQDDAVLCDNFNEFCEYLIEKFPHAVYTLFNRRDFNHSYPYGSILQHGTVTGGVVIIIPKNYIHSVIENQENDEPNYPHDDEYICYWANRHGIKVLTTFPSCVDTLDDKSILGNCYGKSLYYTNNPLSIDWKPKTKHKWINRDFTKLSAHSSTRKKNLSINDKLPYLKLIEQYNAIPISNKKQRQSAVENLVSCIGDYSDIIPPFIADEPCVNMHIGNNVYIHPYCLVQGTGDIFIGDRTKVGCNVSFITSNHGIRLEDRDNVICNPICIEEDVWIGANVTILGGITIGKGSVIGAGSVVTKDIQPMCVAVGNPCNTIKFIE